MDNIQMAYPNVDVFYSSYHWYQHGSGPIHFIDWPVCGTWGFHQLPGIDQVMGALSSHTLPSQDGGILSTRLPLHQWNQTSGLGFQIWLWTDHPVQDRLRHTRHVGSHRSSLVIHGLLVDGSHSITNLSRTTSSVDNLGQCYHLARSEHIFVWMFMARENVGKKYCDILFVWCESV